MKLFASSEISSNESSSKSQLAIVTLTSVSLSSSPMNGDSPDSLRRGDTMRGGRREERGTGRAAPAGDRIGEPGTEEGSEKGINYGSCRR